LGAHFPQVAPVAIISLRSLLRFTFNPYGVGALEAHFPQVAPVAIISLRSLLRFTFNPYGVGALGGTFSTGCTCGYYLATLVTTFHIQPLRGWHFDKVSKK